MGHLFDGVWPVNKRSTITVFVLLFSSIVEAHFYRYVDSDGQTIVVDSLNQGAINFGYQVIGSNGQVIETVPRALTRQEREAAVVRQQEAAVLQAWDESLLLRYSTVEDIEAAEIRALQELDVRIGILRSNQASLNTQLKSEQSKAANLERAGRAVPADQQNRIRDLAIELEATKESSALRREERLALQDSYRKDRERFAELKAIAELRNTFYQ